MELEARAVLAALGQRGAALPAMIETHEVPVEVRAIGIRGAQMPAIDDETGAVIVAGVAGGLDPSVELYDIVIDDPAGLVPDSVPGRRGLISSQTHIVPTSTEKAWLFRRTGALAVDMELAKVREAYAGLAVPVIGIRAISDSACDSLDPRLTSLIDGLGRVRPGAVLWNFIRRPWMVLSSIRLVRRTSMALARLGEIIRQLVESEEFIRRFGSSADCRGNREPAV